MSALAAVLLGLGVLTGAVVLFFYLAPERALAWAINGERRRAGLVARTIDLPGGLRYAYLEGGQGDPLMLLHGFGADKDNFTRVARYLTPHYRVIIPDHIGFGESSHPADADYRPAAQAERLAALATALGIGPLHVGGSSMGGQIAMAWAALDQARIRSLWLIGPAGIWRGPESELGRLMRETGANPLMATTPDEFAAVVRFVMTAPPFFPRPLLNVKARERIANHALELRIFDQIRGVDIEPAITGLTTPSLLVWGEHDRAIHPGTADLLHQLLPNSTVVIMPGIGHVPMLEDPRGSAADYLRFHAHGR